jgi:hypothetical protein
MPTSFSSIGGGGGGHRGPSLMPTSFPSIGSSSGSASGESGPPVNSSNSGEGGLIELTLFVGNSRTGALSGEVGGDTLVNELCG